MREPRPTTTSAKAANSSMPQALWYRRSHAAVSIGRAAMRSSTPPSRRQKNGSRQRVLCESSSRFNSVMFEVPRIATAVASSIAIGAGPRLKKRRARIATTPSGESPERPARRRSASATNPIDTSEPSQAMPISSSSASIAPSSSGVSRNQGTNGAPAAAARSALTSALTA